MSTANMQLVTIEVELREGEEEPVAKLEEGESPALRLCGRTNLSGFAGEHIEVRVTPIKELYAHLKGSLSTASYAARR